MKERVAVIEAEDGDVSQSNDFKACAEVMESP